MTKIEFNDMEKSNVSSSNVRSIGFDNGTDTLEVEFQNGSIYQYYNFPEHLYERFLQAPSKGRFLYSYIRNAYPYSRVA